MKYVSEVLQARVRLGQDEAYRAIAAETARSQAETLGVLTEIQRRIGAIEKILTDVG